LMKGETLPAIKTETPPESGGKMEKVEGEVEESARINTQTPRLEPGTA